MLRLRTNSKVTQCLVILLVMVGGATSSLSEESKEASRFRVALQNDITEWHPARAQSDEEILLMQTLFEGLTALSPDTLEPEPAAAKSWRIGADRKTYLFFLNEEARWSNGEEVLAEDFVRGWHHVITNPNLPFAYLAREVIDNTTEYFDKEHVRDEQIGIGAEAVSDYVLKVTLKRPVPHILELITLPVFFPEPPKTERKGFLTKFAMVTNGAFGLSTREPGTVVLSKNPYYRNRRAIKFDQIHLLVHPNPYTLLTQVLQNSFDWTGTVDLSGVVYESIFKSLEPTGQQPTLYYLSFDHVTGSADATLPLKRALAAMIPRKRISNYVLHTPHVERVGFILPELPDYDNVRHLELDNAIALRILGEAGFCTPQIKAACTPIPRLVVQHRGDTASKKVALAIVQAWQSGASLAGDVLGPDEALPERGAVIMTLQHYRPHVPSAFANFQAWLPFADQTYKLLLSEALSKTSQKQRDALLRQSEANLVRSMPVIPVAIQHTSSRKAKGVEGIYKNFLDIHPLKHVYRTSP